MTERSMRDTLRQGAALRYRLSARCGHLRCPSCAPSLAQVAGGVDVGARAMTALPKTPMNVSAPRTSAFDRIAATCGIIIGLLVATVTMLVFSIPIVPWRDGAGRASLLLPLLVLYAVLAALALWQCWTEDRQSTFVIVVATAPLLFLLVAPLLFIPGHLERDAL